MLWMVFHQTEYVGYVLSKLRFYGIGSLRKIPTVGNPPIDPGPASGQLALILQPTNQSNFDFLTLRILIIQIELFSKCLLVRSFWILSRYFTYSTDVYCVFNHCTHRELFLKQGSIHTLTLFYAIISPQS